MPQEFVEKLIRRIESIHALDGDDLAALKAIPLQVHNIASRQDIVREGDRPGVCCVLFDGMAGWYKVTGEGKRQFLAFHIAGDIPDLHSPSESDGQQPTVAGTLHSGICVARGGPQTLCPETEFG